MTHRDRTPLHTIEGGAGARFTTTAWDGDHTAALEASGSDVRSTLETGLRAVLTLADAGAPNLPASDRSAPLQAQGADLAELFRDLIDDFLDHMASSAHACRDVVVDGVLHRDGAGYVAWGYAAESSAPAPAGPLPYLNHMPTVERTKDGIVFRATFAREGE